jgi:glucosamine-phosphate N-acetyltransferase
MEIEVFIERKLIHGCGRVAHLERVARGASDTTITVQLLELAKRQAQLGGCYKIIAPCAPAEQHTFEMAGFANKGLQMHHGVATHCRLDERVPLTATAAMLSARPSSISAPHLELRALNVGDFDRGILALLAQLTVVGDVSRTQFESIVPVLCGDAYLTLVIADKEDGGALIGVGTVVLAGPDDGVHKRAHIEDIVVHERARGRGLGALIIRALVDAACAAGARSVLLECSPENEGFYSKLGFADPVCSMGFYFTEA